MRERASGAGASPAERGGRDARSTQGKASMLDAAGCAIAGLLLIMGGTANASESGIINLDSKSAGASTLQADGDGNPVGSPSFNFVDDYDSGLDFSGSASTQYNDMGFAGSASSVWNHAYDPGNPGLGNAFSAVYMSGSSASNSTSDGILVGPELRLRQLRGLFQRRFGYDLDVFSRRHGNDRGVRRHRL